KVAAPGGLKGALSSLFGGAKLEEAREEAQAEGPELAPYQRRAEELLARLRQGAAPVMTPAARITALGMLAAQLATLVEDLESVGVAAAIVEPLRGLLASLRRELSRPSLTDRDAEALWREAEQVLEAFAKRSGATTGASETGRRSRDDFWK
ncbi:hypothetical protein L6R52_33400, partial [Myxococcota bacterium]|nr:hypothetical protein [Myxococcota bacterium]